MAETKDERGEQDEGTERGEGSERDEGTERDEGSERDEGTERDEGSERDEGPRDSDARAEEERPQEEELEPRELSQEELVGMDVIDSHGVKIGKIEALFIHQREERASWARVKTGIGPIGSHVFIPLHDAQDEDGRLRVVYEKEHVGEAPEIEPDGNEISDDDADQLHSYYGLERVQGLATETKDQDIELSRDTREAEPPTMKDPPWAVEKYPLPDMDRENVREEGEGDEDRAEHDRPDDEDQEQSEEGS